MRTASILSALVLALAAVCNIRFGIDPQFRNAVEDRDVVQRSREATFHQAIDLYRTHPRRDDWRARVTIDRRLSKGAGGLSVQRLEELLHGRPHDLDVATAVAVCLGDGSVEDPAKQTVKLFEELLASPYERVRYRASESIIQRLAEGTLDQTGSELLLPAVEAAISTEKLTLNVSSLEYAKRLLTDPAPIWLGK
jgi:hypothetical protein